MRSTELLYREYREDDYKQCEALVNEAWGFDMIFAPQELSDLAKYMYTKASVLWSNYRTILEIHGKVAGFIFGLNERSEQPGLNIGYRLNVLFKILRVKSEKPADKNDFLNALKYHEKNRQPLIPKKRSEIILFVIGKKYQGKGYGQKLWSGFLTHCQNSSVASIVVETNKLGASSFYEMIGFKHLGDFDSPLHEFATKGGQACVYQYSC